MLNSRPNIDAELGLITLRLQKQELEEVFRFFNFESLKFINFEKKIVPIVSEPISGVRC